MNLKKRMLVLLLAVVMIVGSIPAAFAADLTVGTETNAVADGAGNSVVTVTAEATQMTVTVPSILPASIDTAGNVTVATDAELRNQSYGPVTVTAIKAEGLNGWALAGAEYNFAKAKVGAKAVQVAIDEAVADAASGAIAVLNKWVVPGSDKYGFSYDLKIPAQKEAIASAQPAKVIFTVDWYDGSTEPTVEENPETGEVNSLSLDKDYIPMYPGTAETIHATASTEQMVALLSLRTADEPVTWESTNTDVATVENGKVTALSLGRTTIKANYKGVTATCAVQVKEAPVPLEAIGFSKTPVQLMTGESETVLLTYNPEKFTGAADVTFSVNGDAVTVEPTSLTGVTGDDGATPVTITATGSGTAVVSASATVDGKTVTAQMSTEVMVPLESLTIAGENSVVAGETITLTATKNPANTTDTAPITWASSDDGIATVNNGVVTGVAEGEVTITATCGGISVNWSVTVAFPVSEASIDWEYTTDAATNTITLTKYIGESNDVVARNRYLVDGELYNNVALGKSGYNSSSGQFFGPFAGSTKTKSITSITLEDGVALPTDMNCMFNNCNSLSLLDVSDWDTSNVTDMNGMFYNCYSLTTLDVSGWNTSSVTNMGSMFSGCSQLPTLDVSGWDTSKVTSMGSMFDGCRDLTTLDFSGWDTSGVGWSVNMFRNCNQLQQVTLGSSFMWVGSYLPEPDRFTIPGANGKWYTANRIAYAPMNIPSNVAATYYASPSLIPAATGD